MQDPGCALTEAEYLWKDGEWPGLQAQLSCEHRPQKIYMLCYGLPLFILAEIFPAQY